jgi:hypothetical protein
MIYLINPLREALHFSQKLRIKLFQKQTVSEEVLNPPDPRTQLLKRRQEAIERGEKALSAISSHLSQGDRTRLDFAYTQLNSAFEMVELADEAIALFDTHERGEAKTIPAISIPTYHLSSWFLADCFSFITADPKGYERLHMVTGIKLSQTERTLDRMVKVSHSLQTVTNAKADTHDLSKTLIELSERWAHSLHGLFHSHPAGWGVRGCNPSSTDLDTHKRYENGGYPLIGAIFVKQGDKGGYVRFFTNNRPFTIIIHGRGVTPIDKNEHLYKIRF